MNSVNHLSPAAVLELARLNGIPVEDEAMAARIAAGGAAAAAAVEAIRKANGRGQDVAALSAVEPADYLPTLESLAGTQSPTGERQAFKDIQKVKEFGEVDLVSDVQRPEAVYGEFIIRGDVIEFDVTPRSTSAR